ncbi:MAG TPA: chromate transporter [Rhodocyclaceae bacterium]|nr:chromate transporter [Rhodocyclaceae bacterium]
MVSIADIVASFLLLSLMAFGGGNAALPEMHRIAVEQYHWMTDKTFTELFAVAQAAPGPNILVVALIGLKAAGVAGFFAATAALCLPSSVLIYCLFGVWERLRNWSWRPAIELGVAPLAVGLVLSSGWLMTNSGGAPLRSIVLALVTVIAVLRVQCNPLWWIAAGAVLGLAGIV